VIRRPILSKVSMALPMVFSFLGWDIGNYIDKVKQQPCRGKKGGGNGPFPHQSRGFSDRRPCPVGRPCQNIRNGFLNSITFISHSFGFSIVALCTPQWPRSERLRRPPVS
jgi:hypothetical protein